MGNPKKLHAAGILFTPLKAALRNKGSLGGEPITQQVDDAL